MSHTLGPWELLDGRNIKTVNGIFFLSYGCDEHSKKPFFFSKENGWSELDANAKLTAAAPELLEALREISNVLNLALPKFELNDESSDDEDSYDDVVSVLTRAKAAIAKATGVKR